MRLRYRASNALRSLLASKSHHHCISSDNGRGYHSISATVATRGLSGWGVFSLLHFHLTPMPTLHPRAMPSPAEPSEAKSS